MTNSSHVIDNYKIGMSALSSTEDVLRHETLIPVLTGGGGHTWRMCGPMEVQQKAKGQPWVASLGHSLPLLTNWDEVFETGFHWDLGLAT